MTTLSPAAQAQKMLDAYYMRLDHEGPRCPEALGLADALTEAVDQVLPEADTIDTEEWIGQSAWQQAEQSVRFRFLAIAAELDGGTTTPTES
jgi:hypothetical protein